MLSTCPSCLNQILHDDGAEQLSCECGEKFSPFLTLTPAVDINSNSALMAMSEKHSFEEPPNFQSDVDPPADYRESEAAFAELRQFGESLGGVDIDANVVAQPPSSLENPQNFAPPMATEAVVPNSQQPPQNAVSASHSGTCLITAGDHLAGFEITAFLQPISIWCPASVEAEDPLKGAHDILSKRAEQLGANGVVSVRWSFTPDGTRILLTGTPVKCRKQN